MQRRDVTARVRMCNLYYIAQLLKRAIVLYITHHVDETEAVFKHHVDETEAVFKQVQGVNDVHMFQFVPSGHQLLTL